MSVMYKRRKKSFGVGGLHPSRPSNNLARRALSKAHSKKIFRCLEIASPTFAHGVGQRFHRTRVKDTAGSFNTTKALNVLPASPPYRAGRRNFSETATPIALCSASSFKKTVGLALPAFTWARSDIGTMLYMSGGLEQYVLSANFVKTKGGDCAMKWRLHHWLLLRKAEPLKRWWSI